MERKTIYIIIAAVFCIILSANIYSSIQSHEYRRLCDQYRKQLITTEATNRELTDRIERITEITGRITEIVERIAETTERNVTETRVSSERIEILREQI